MKRYEDLFDVKKESSNLWYGAANKLLVLLSAV